jgi:hypothetical protein
MTRFFLDHVAPGYQSADQLRQTGKGRLCGQQDLGGGKTGDTISYHLNQL